VVQAVPVQKQVGNSRTIVLLPSEQFSHIFFYEIWMESKIKRESLKVRPDIFTITFRSYELYNSPLTQNIVKLLQVIV